MFIAQRRIEVEVARVMQIRGLPRPEADLGQGTIMDTGRGND
jgi:hypothetical protein